MKLAHDCRISDVALASLEKSSQQSVTFRYFQHRMRVGWLQTLVANGLPKTEQFKVLAALPPNECNSHERKSSEKLKERQSWN